MENRLYRLAWVGLSGILFVAGCKDPKLQSEASKEAAEAMDEVVATAPANSYEELRRAVIGQTFENLTLGSRKYILAEVLEITDQVIVVSHAGGEDRVPWSEVPEEVRERWGYDPSADTLVDKLVDMLPGIEAAKEAVSGKEEVSPQSPPITTPARDPQVIAREIAQKEQMLKAQLAGIQALESDLSRHSISLQSLRAQLQSVRARISSGGKGGVRVERIGGESTVVDRRKEAGELEAKVKAEEQLVAQFSKSLQTARQQYQTLTTELIQLRQL